MRTDLEKYGEYLRALRIHRRLSREEVGLRLGFSLSSARNVIGRWERGERRPSLQYLRPLMDLYQVSAADILPPDPPAPPAQPNERNTSPDHSGT